MPELILGLLFIIALAVILDRYFRSKALRNRNERYLVHFVGGSLDGKKKYVSEMTRVITYQDEVYRFAGDTPDEDDRYVYSGHVTEHDADFSQQIS